MALLCLLGEQFREFHLTPVGFLFLFHVCNLLYICWLFSCLTVTELLQKTPGLWGEVTQVNVKVRMPRGWTQEEECAQLFVHDSPQGAVFFISFNTSRCICEILLTFPQQPEIFVCIQDIKSCMMIKSCMIIDSQEAWKIRYSSLREVTSNSIELGYFSN